MDRFMLAIGGFVGFGGSFLCALNVAGDDISTALLRSSIGMIAGVILMKILVSLAHSVFRDARREKLQSVATTAHKEETSASHETAPAAEPSHNTRRNQ